MATIPLTFRAAPFPEGYKANPEKLKNDIVARLYAESTESISFFASGSVAPSSNVGPWLKNGTEWYVWSDDSGSYVPQTITQGTLRYAVQFGEPDPAVYLFWIELDVSGSPLAVKTYYSGAWVDVYSGSLGTYMTTAAFDAAIANYSTTTQMNSAIAAATFRSYPGQGTSLAPQSILADGVAVEVVIDSDPINPSPGPINIGSSRYIAPASGIYAVAVTSQFDNDDATAASMEIRLGIYKNGVNAGIGDTDGTPSPNGSRWSPTFTSLISLAAFDYLQLYAVASDGVGTGHVDLTTFSFSVWRVSS